MPFKGSPETQRCSRGICPASEQGLPRERGVTSWVHIPSEPLGKEPQLGSWLWRPPALTMLFVGLRNQRREVAACVALPRGELKPPSPTPV